MFVSAMSPFRSHTTRLLRANPATKGRALLGIKGPAQERGGQRQGKAWRLQQRIDCLFSRLGHAVSFVEVKLSRSPRIVAQAEGMLVDGVPCGIIRVNVALSEILTDQELEFVLGHEVSHIQRNHLASQKLFSTVRGWAERRSKRDSRFKWLLIGYDVFQVYKLWRGELPPVPRVARDNELEADRDGVFLVGGDANIAKSALLKLVGGNADAPSHMWSIRGVPVPTMTIRERLAHIEGAP